MYVDKLSGKDIVVVDMTHGGIQLCDQYHICGANVTVVDVHRTLTDREKDYLNSRSIRVFQDFSDAVGQVDPYLVAMQYSPDREAISKYCGKMGVPLLSHARATGLLLSDHLREKKVVEVTGACGKTTTINNLESILHTTGKESMVMSSTGVRIISKDGTFALDGHGSITPAYALKAVSLTEKAGYDPEYYVFEVSLGGMGIGSVGAVLGVPLHLDVGIGRSAFFSKAQMAQYISSSSVLCLNGDDPATKRMETMTDAMVNTFSINGGETVYADRKAIFPGDERLRIFAKDLHTVDDEVVNTDVEIRPDPSFFGRVAVSNMLSAASIAFSLGIGDENIARGLENSKPPLNRMVASEHHGQLMVSSTATSKETIVTAISEVQNFARHASKGILLVVGGKARTTCGKVDYDGLSEILNLHIKENGNLALYGELGREMERRGCGSSLDSKEAALSSFERDGKEVILACTN